jgi:hypothetical protein
MRSFMTETTKEPRRELTHGQQRKKEEWLQDKERTMNKEKASAGVAQSVRVLQNEELDTVNGGFGFVERGFVINGGKLLGSPEELRALNLSGK